MDGDRELWLIDRWGVTWEDEVTLQRFAELFDELDPDDHEHCVVDIEDSNGRSVEFSPTTVVFGNAEERVEAGTVELKDRAHALTIAGEFFAGDYEALRRRPWA